MLDLASQPDNGYDTDPGGDLDYEDDEYDEYEEYAPPGLQNILPGTWQVNINMPTPMGMVPMQLNLEMHPNGYFQGAASTFTIQGQWSISAMQQVMLTGQQSNGMQVVPYNVAIQFTQVSQNQLNGYTSGSETTAWYRIA
jgi:hypothetical protein